MNTLLANLLLIFSIVSFVTGICMIFFFIADYDLVSKEPHEILLEEFGNRIAKMKKNYKKKYGK